MQKVDLSLTKILENSQGEVSEAALKQKSKAAGRDHIDAINQMFAEFELAYHNQFHKAYAQEGSMGLAKKYWLSCLGDLSPEMILRATRKVVSTQEFLPSVASIIQACEDALNLFGLPSLHDAYVEACCASLPKVEYKWSHPAVYLAGKATGWFELANQSQAQIESLFEYNYRLLCEQVISGKELSESLPKALPQSSSVALSMDENISNLNELRKNLNL